jgi:hypothetical protein
MMGDVIELPTHTIEPWDPEIHMPMLTKWCAQSGFTPGHLGFYPPNGYVVDKCAVGFLFRTDAPKLGYIDNVYTDQTVPALKRVKAIQLLCRKLCERADQLEVELVYAFTDMIALDRICQKNGFIRFGKEFSCLIRARGGMR